MKIKDDDKNISGKLRLTDDQSDKLDRYSTWGIPGSDPKGSYPYYFNVRIRENQKDVMNGIRELSGGFYQSNAEMMRNIVAAGSLVLIIKWMMPDGTAEKILRILDSMNILAKHDRTKSLFDEVSRIEGKILTSDDPTELKSKSIEFSKDIRKQIKELTGEV